MSTFFSAAYNVELVEGRSFFFAKEQSFDWYLGKEVCYRFFREQKKAFWMVCVVYTDKKIVCHVLKRGLLEHPFFS